LKLRSQEKANCVSTSQTIRVISELASNVYVIQPSDRRLRPPQ
jgi:hypothetical protein